jgi:hypothetical protein
MPLRPSIGEAKGPQYNIARAIQSFLGLMAAGGIPLGSAVSSYNTKSLRQQATKSASPAVNGEHNPDIKTE